MKKLLYTCISLFLFILILFGLYKVSISRSFQFFGDITSSINTEERVVALTFDDGPTKYTREVLDILKEKNISATFYVIGSDLEKHSDIGAAIVVEGHELGNHSYSHPRFFLKFQSFIDNEIQRTNELIGQAGFDGKITFRPPYGKKLFGLPWYLMIHRIDTVTWDVEPDSFGSESDFIVQHTIENVKNGSIILLHPLCESCNGQRDAIPKIIDALHEQGYKFLTVSELLRLDQN
ncbi:polysaccharide deacetylase [Candidatus Uhrbacteria bacterium CG_4_9_14_3_um_filter_36_7]|uniref:Polysaccharide deacetylase n=1 Tax=Candidatus Uhrbacteria bacterium CG_4_9_14_3_um_filter_36_7 TaxID=1975033 RepID=A0A2M7XHX4_9BACT|nr:MAG: polysaccharide deacetylase [Candidatus Uhrbacteria bacterium CG_4_9_14_3_um_filter_36_7]